MNPPPTTPPTALRNGLLAAAWLLAGGAAQAAEYGRVLSSTPVMAQVATPSTHCVEELQPAAARTSGSGAIVGAVIGAAIGHAVGHGTGRAAATGLGLVAGAALGDRAEAAGLPHGDVVVRTCHRALSYEHRVIGYDVEYEYQGRRHRARLAQDPGDRIALNVVVTPVAEPMAAPPASRLGPPPGYGADDLYGGPRAVITVVPRIVPGGDGGHRGRHGHWR